MSTKPAAAAAPPADSTTFYLKKSYVRPIAQAVSDLQQRTDLSGKFARKVGRVRRAITKADEEIQAQRQDLVLAHAEKHPEGHADAGKPTPVYATGPAGEPMFKKDKAGNDTDERIIVPEQYNVADPGAFQVDFKAMLDEVMTLECPCFKEDELNSFKGISGKIIDALMYLEEGAETTIAPADMKTLELVREDPDVPETPALEAAAAEDRTAP
jgi:hypothetical protein